MDHGTTLPLVGTPPPEQDCGEVESHVLSLAEFSDDYLDVTHSRHAKQSSVRPVSDTPPRDGLAHAKTVPRSRDVSRSSRNRARSSTARTTPSVSGGAALQSHVEGRPHRVEVRLPTVTPARVVRTSAKRGNASVSKENGKTNESLPKQDMDSYPELVSNSLQRELARLNLNVLRNMAQMLDEQEQKFAAERNTLRASGRLMRAEMRRALSETVKINSERQKLNLERDVLQSQLLARRRSARLLDLMIRDFEHGREQTAPAQNINRLYTYSRVLGSAPAHGDLGEQLDYETNILDQQRFYLQSLMWPRWQQFPTGGELTRMHPPRIPASQVESGRGHVGDETSSWDWPRPEVSRDAVDGRDVTLPVGSGPMNVRRATSITLQDALSPHQKGPRFESGLPAYEDFPGERLNSVSDPSEPEQELARSLQFDPRLNGQQVVSDEYFEQYDEDTQRHTADVSSIRTAQGNHKRR